MALKRNYSVYPVLVLFFGLISCSKDKEMVYQPTPVAGFNVGALDSERKMQWAQDIKELSLGDELTIDFLNQQNLQSNPITVRVQSWCNAETSAKSFDSDLYFQNKLSIPVLNVLSPDALLSLGQHPLECRIVLTLTNSISSSAIYNLVGIKIKNSVEFTNMAATMPSFAESSLPVFYETIKVETLLKGNQRLLCEDFQKMTTGAETWEQLMNSSTTDPSQWTKSTQTCRLLVVDGDTISLSPRFQMVFAPQELLIRPELHRLPGPTIELNPRPVITLRVTNPNSFGVKIKVQNLLESRFVFSPIYSGMGAVGHPGYQRDVPLTWSLHDTPHLTSSNGNEWIIELPAKQEIAISGLFAGNFHCQDTLGLPQRSPYFVGIHYGFDFKIQFQTHLVDEQWQTTNLLQGVLSVMNNGQPAFWDLFYEQIRRAFGRSFQNPTLTTNEFIHTVRFDKPYDRCVAR